MYAVVWPVAVVPKIPLGQTMQLELPVLSLYCPLGQAMQLLAPAVPLYFPAGQAMQWVAVLEPATVPNIPGLQAVHTLSPSVAEYFPGVHETHLSGKWLVSQRVPAQQEKTMHESPADSHPSDPRWLATIMMRTRKLVLIAGAVTR